MLIPGRCHCGNIAFVLDWQPEPSQIPARACTCSFCVKHGGVWTSCATGALRITVGDAARVSQYEFGTRTAQFQVCATCGIVPLVTCRIEDRLYAVVSVNALEGLDRVLLQHAVANFEGESTAAARLARRKRTWIGDVQYVGSGL